MACRCNTATEMIGWKDEPEPHNIALAAWNADDVKVPTRVVLPPRYVVVSRTPTDANRGMNIGEHDLAIMVPTADGLANSLMKEFSLMVTPEEMDRFLNTHDDLDITARPIRFSMNEGEMVHASCALTRVYRRTASLTAIFHFRSGGLWEGGFLSPSSARKTMQNYRERRITTPPILIQQAEPLEGNPTQ